jgi:hypothetical protein
VKSINASLERIHTFGMSSVHKSKHDLEKIDHQYDAILKKKDKKIVKTASLAKLKSVTQNSPGDMEQKQRNGKGLPATSTNFLSPKDIASNHDEMSQVSSASIGSTGTDKQIKISVSMKLIDPKPKMGEVNNEQFLAPQD